MKSILRGRIGSMTRFVRDNSFYIMFQELNRRIGVAFRRGMFGEKLGCPDIVLGPRCHLRGIAHIHIGAGFQAAEGLWLEAVTSHAGFKYQPRIVIGEHVSVSRWSHIAATHSVEIGDGVLIGSRVIITDHNHGQYGTSPSPVEIRPNLRPLDSAEKVIIERNVWLGDGVVVTPGSRICEGAIIGANAVVTGTIAPWTIAVGIPARSLKKYDFDAGEWVRI